MRYVPSRCFVPIRTASQDCDRGAIAYVFVMNAKDDQGLAGAAMDRPPDQDSAKKLTPQAERALAEAAARRAEIDRRVAEQPKELRGRQGPEPTRYGDWETKGIASDF
jgi:hypothetical protein